MKKIAYLLFLPTFAFSLFSCETSTAHWVYFETHCETPLEPIRVKVIEATPIVENGSFTLEGWFTESTYENIVNFPYQVTADITLHAKWSEESPIQYGTDFYDDYYDGINTWENGEDLKEKLFNIIRDGYQALPYTSPNWETNQFADQAIDDFEKVDVVYDSVNDDKTNTYASGFGWQREHAFAASLMTGYLSGEAVSADAGRATDYHNLFASFNKGNGSRGNKNFGIANKDSEFFTFGKDGQGDFASDDLNFEPSDYDKGRLARAIFYMGVMYSEEETATISITGGSSQQVTYEPLTIQEEYVPYNKVSYALYPNNPDLVATYGSGLAGYAAYSLANCSFAIGNLSTLLDWNNRLVDRLEYQHNISVYSHVFVGNQKAQGNRNPFVDYPELVEYVYGDKRDEPGQLTYLKPTYLDLKLDQTNEIANYAIKTAKRSYEEGDTFKKEDYELIEVYRDYSTKVNSSFADVTESYVFTAQDVENGSKAISIATPINTINYGVKVTSADPMNHCDYKYALTGKASGGDLVGFVNGNSVNLGGTAWNISWTNAQAAIGNKDATYGVAFGTSTKAVGSLTFVTTSNIADVDGFYAKISCAAGKTVNYLVKIGAQTVASGSVTRVSGTTTAPEIIGGSLATPIQGILSITIDGSGASAGAIYIHTLAYHTV